MFKVPEKFRLTKGVMGSTEAHGNNGAFLLEISGAPVRVIASDGAGWEHVSVSLKDRCPTWEEMYQVKALFWDDQDCVVQFHPPKSEYVNNHPYCLHLWRPIGVEIPLPPSLLVGIKELGNLG